MFSQEASWGSFCFSVQALLTVESLDIWDLTIPCTPVPSCWQIIASNIHDDLYKQAVWRAWLSWSTHSNSTLRGNCDGLVYRACRSLMLEPARLERLAHCCFCHQFHTRSLGHNGLLQKQIICCYISRNKDFFLSFKKNLNNDAKIAFLMYMTLSNKYWYF